MRTPSVSLFLSLANARRAYFIAAAGHVVCRLAAKASLADDSCVAMATVGFPCLTDRARSYLAPVLPSSALAVN